MTKSSRRFVSSHRRATISPPSTLTNTSAVKLALMAKQARAEAQQLINADPIAIIGMGCRVPGGAATPEQYWQSLCDGIDAVAEVPADRWPADQWYDSDISAVAKTATKWGAFLESVDSFDAEYFGILPREAARMDPQQRLFLEVAFEAIDDAGLAHERLRGSRTGVFAASYHNDYAHLQYADPEAIDLRTLTGTLHSVLANRVSYLLDLHGPSITIDTACSSSLVAVHLACQNLRSGEIDTAIAGGVSVIIGPELMVSMSKVGFMAPDGRSKAFDASANGFGRGEGCGVIVLRRLSDAIANSDRILAVIRGSGSNQDGHSTLMTAPNGRAQAELIRETLAKAHLEPGRIGYVETHGTGTSLGDPIEVEAIAETIGKQSGASGPCYLGSVKANIGHLEAAAGIVGLIKAVLVLMHEAIPPQIHFDKLNPLISLDRTRLKISKALQPWPAEPLSRCAAVSSFGVGGTNAHVVLEEAPKIPATSSAVQSEGSHLLPLSARSADGLTAHVEEYTRFLTDPSVRFSDVCHTASGRRSHFDYRLAVVALSAQVARSQLDEFLRSGAATDVMASRGAVTGSPRVGFVFCGQGPQRHGMGCELAAQEPVFRSVITECDALLRPLSGWSLVEELARPEDQSRLSQTEFAQPALFALQVAIAKVLASWGVKPEAVLGHSVGEIAALHLAGVLDLEEAIRVVWHRGRNMQRATGMGRMASVALSEQEARSLISPYGDRLSVAAVNAPRSVVLSGEAEALSAALAAHADRGGTHRELRVDYAFHSAQMAPIERDLARDLDVLRVAAPRVALHSTVTGGPLNAAIDAAYVARGVRDPVRFASALQSIIEAGCNVLIEVGPHPVLTSAIEECVAAYERPPAAIGTLRRGRGERDAMLRTAAALYAEGQDLKWNQLEPHGQHISLPSYPWQRKRHWLRQHHAASAFSAHSIHPVLGLQVSIAGSNVVVFEGDSERSRAWAVDHRLFDSLLLPGAAVLEAFAAAAGKVLSGESVALSGFAMHRPMFVAGGTGPDSRWQVVVKRLEGGTAELEFHEAIAGVEGGAAWRLVASAAAASDVARPPTTSVSDVRPVDADAFYASFEERGAHFGPSFRRLSEIVCGKGYAQAWVRPFADGEEGAAGCHILHPTVIDAGIQLASLAAHGRSSELLPGSLFLPLGADRVVIRPAPAEPLRATVVARETPSNETVAADVWLQTAAGDLVACIEGLRLAKADPRTFTARHENRGVLYDVGWRRLAAEPQERPRLEKGVWLLFADDGGIAESLGAEIKRTGRAVQTVFAATEYRRISQDAWSIDPFEPAHFHRLMDESGVGPQTHRGIIHCWSLDAATLQSEGVNGAKTHLVGPSSVLHLLQGLAAGARQFEGQLLLLTRGAQVVTGREAAEGLRPRAAALWGLASVIALEHPEFETRVIDLDLAETTNVDELLLSEIQSGTNSRIAIREAARWVPRLQPRDGLNTVGPAAREAQRVHVSLARPGTIDGVDLQPLASLPLPNGSVRVRVVSAGLNFRDVLVALGMYPGAEAPPFGAECAGIVTDVGAGVEEFRVGNQVVGLAPGSLATEAVVPASYLVKLPNEMRAEEAAALPVAYLTAAYGFDRLARLQRDQTVLIHAAAGGVGTAAVRLAQRRGAQVFATAGSDAKRGLLRSMGVENVMNSRTLAFADEILAATHGRGVDVVLNSLAGDFIPASLRALARGGTFLELGKRGIWSSEEVAKARPDVRYLVYDLSAEAEADPAFVRPMLHDIFAGINDGSLHPLPVATYPLDRVRDAMRQMAQARHVGKIVICVEQDDADDRRREFGVAPDATYWITGGTGALGIETARWLVDRGARHLALSARRSPSPETMVAIRELEARGAVVKLFEADASDRATMQCVFATIGASMPPLRGVFHASGVLHDAILLSQKWTDSTEVFKAKSDGAWVLHELTRDVPLDFFVLYSAAGLILGAPGQGMYPAANAQLDALAQARHRMGLPALSVAWGQWGGKGMAAELAARGRNVWSARGLQEIVPALGFAQLERLLVAGVAYGAVMPISWARFFEQLPAGADRAFFEAVAPQASVVSTTAPRRAPALIEKLKAAPAGQRRHALMSHLVERIAHVIGTDPAAKIDSRTPLKEAGLDSLMAVELRNTLTRSSGRPLPATLLFDYPTLDALAAYLMRAWELDADGDGAIRDATGSAAVAATAADVSRLSDAEAEALLLKELTSEVVEKSA